MLKALFRLGDQSVHCIDSHVRHASISPRRSPSSSTASNAQIERLAEALSDGGKALMPLGDYGFSQRFAWLADRFRGVLAAQSGLSPAAAVRLPGGLPAHIDPLRIHQLGHPLRARDRAVHRPGGRKHFVEGLQRDVAVHRQRRRQAERADSADRARSARPRPRRRALRLAAEGGLDLGLSSRASPAPLPSTVRSPTRSDRVLAIRPGSTPWASAARATVAVLVSSSDDAQVGAFSRRRTAGRIRRLMGPLWRNPRTYASTPRLSSAARSGEAHTVDRRQVGGELLPVPPAVLAEPQAAGGRAHGRRSPLGRCPGRGGRPGQAGPSGSRARGSQAVATVAGAGDHETGVPGNCGIRPWSPGRTRPCPAAAGCNGDGEAKLTARRPRPANSRRRGNGRCRCGAAPRRMAHENEGFTNPDKVTV